MEALAVEMRNITKIFGGVKANDSVKFCLRPGSIHGLLGENGAGKTTVSYTHLDVYKRQSQYRARNQAGSKRGGKTGNPPGGGRGAGLRSERKKSASLSLRDRRRESGFCGD